MFKSISNMINNMFFGYDQVLANKVKKRREQYEIAYKKLNK